MNRQEQTEFNHLKKVNKNLRDKINHELKKYMDEYGEPCQEIWTFINLLIENELEQEVYTNHN